MGINTESDITANLQIGPTTDGMVRIFVEAGDVEIPMDFEPEEALDIAEEIRAAALSITGELTPTYRAEREGAAHLSGRISA